MTHQATEVVDQQAQEITDRVQDQGVAVGDSGLKGFIKELGPIFLQLLPFCAAFLGQNPSDKTPTAKEFADEHYDRSTGTFDRDVVRSMGRTTRRHARKKHRPMNRNESEVIAAEYLAQGHTADDDTVTAFCAQCPACEAEPQETGDAKLVKSEVVKAHK